MLTTIENLEVKISGLEEKLDLLINIFNSNCSKFYTLETLSRELNRTMSWMYKNKHIFSEAIVVVDPDSSKIMFSKKKVHQIIEKNSKIFQGDI